jgi:hypothetical protein
LEKKKINYLRRLALNSVGLNLVPASIFSSIIAICNIGFIIGAGAIGDAKWTIPGVAISVGCPRNEY